VFEALQGAGLAAAGKHFPGHGDTSVDSHLDLPICELPPDRLRAVELVPFREAVAANVACMLTCHVLFTEIDAEYPATLSPRVAFNHDVNGTSPGPGGNFIDGRKSITVGVEANYLNRWSVDLSYTDYFGAGQFNLISDRDFVALVAKYSF